MIRISERSSKKAVQEAGFDSEFDRNGSQYQRILSERMPDLVILDLHLPYASGKEILANLQKDPKTANLPSLVVTADLYLAKGIQAVNENVILKPVNPVRLIELVRKLLQSKDSQQS